MNKSILFLFVLLVAMSGYGHAQTYPPTGAERAKFRLAELEMVDEAYLSKPERKAIRKEKRQLTRAINRATRRVSYANRRVSPRSYGQPYNSVYRTGGGYCD